MRIATGILCWILSLNAFASDFGWFEASWISDADTSVEANPGVENLPNDILEQFRSFFGKTRWLVSNGVLTIEYDQITTVSAPYFLRPIGDAKFEVVLDGPGFQAVSTVQKTVDGFCTKPNPTWVKEYQIWAQPNTVECFVLVDA